MVYATPPLDENSGHTTLGRSQHDLGQHDLGQHGRFPGKTWLRDAAPAAADSAAGAAAWHGLGRHCVTINHDIGDQVRSGSP